jgi:hypothetical protein
MSLSKSLTRAAFMAVALASVAATAGCTSFRPVYGSGTLAAQPMLDLAYAKPNSRLEQVIYEELSLRLGESSDATAPLASVRVTQSVANSTISRTQNLRKPVEVTVTATLTITQRDGSSAEIKTYTRRATANYTRSSQVIADNVAATEAAERAAKAAAESLRLAVLADLSR